MKKLMGKMGMIGKLASLGSSFGSFGFGSFGASYIKIIFNYLFELIIIISLIYSSSNYGKNIVDDVELKTCLISLNFLILLLVVGYIFNKYTQLNKMMHSEHPDG